MPASIKRYMNAAPSKAWQQENAGPAADVQNLIRPKQPAQAKPARGPMNRDMQSAIGSYGKPVGGQAPQSGPQRLSPGVYQNPNGHVFRPNGGAPPQQQQPGAMNQAMQGAIGAYGAYQGGNAPQGQAQGVGRDQMFNKPMPMNPGQMGQVAAAASGNQPQPYTPPGQSQQWGQGQMPSWDQMQNMPRNPDPGFQMDPRQAMQMYQQSPQGQYNMANPQDIQKQGQQQQAMQQAGQAVGLMSRPPQRY